MLLTCPKCATRYEVDGSSIPQEGTYAHCATCENIFFVKKKLKAAPKDVAKTTIPATGVQPATQPVEVSATPTPAETAPPAVRAPAKEPVKGKEKPSLTPEQVAAIMSGLDYEGKPKDDKNDSTNLTAQSQIDSILGDVHNNIHEKIITAPLPLPAAEMPTMNDSDIENILASVQAQRPETPKPEPTPSVKKEAVGADDIAAILASVQAQQAPAKKEEPKMASSSDIDDIFASVQAQQAPAKKEEPKMASSSDIDDIFASVQAQQAPAKKEEPKMASSSDIDDIFASVQAQQAPAKKEEPKMASSSDIDDIFASVQAQQAPAKKEEPKMASSSDIDDIFASVQAQQAPAKKEEPKMASSSDIDDIFASVQAQQAPAKKEEPKMASSSDIDDIFASVQALQAPAKKEEPKMASSSDIDDIFASVQAQQAPAKKEEPKTATTDDIDAIFAGSNAAVPAGTMDSQDDIDAILMTASAPAPQESILENETSGTTQALSNNDIDSILASVKTEKESPAPAPAPTGEGDIISQSDLDSLFAAATAPSAPAKESEGDIISQSDLDSLLGETKTPLPEAAAAAPSGGDIISQSDLDALMTGGSEAPKAAATTSASQLLEGGDDELESLFAEEAVGSKKAPAHKKAEAAATHAAPPAEYEGIDTSMFEGLDKVTAEVPAATEEHPVEAESKPGKLAGIIDYIKDKLPKRKPKEEHFTVEEESPTAAEPGEEPKKKRAGVFRKIALPLAAGVALMLGAGSYYFMKLKSHPVAVAQKAAAPAKAPAAPAGPVAEQKKAAPPAHEEAKPEAPKAAPPPPAHEEKKAEPPPTATAQGPKPKDAKEIAAAAHDDARKAALEAEKLIPPALAQITIMKVGVMLPVDFNSSQVKMMTADVELQFATSSEFKTAETKKFIYELALENEIEVFFKDKFYEETRYAKDKLMAYLFDRFKKRGDLEKIVGVNVAELTLK